MSYTLGEIVGPLGITALMGLGLGWLLWRWRHRSVTTDEWETVRLRAADCDAADAEVRRLTAVVAGLRDERRLLETRLADRDAAVDLAKRRLDALAAALATERQAATTVAAERDKAVARLEERETAIAAVRAELDRYDLELSTAEADAKAERERATMLCEASERERDVASARIASLESELVELRDRSTAVADGELAGARERIAQLEAELASTSERSRELDARLTRLDERHARSAAGLAAARDRAGALARDLAAAQERTGALERELAGAAQRTTELAGWLRRRDERIERLESELEEARRSHDVVMRRATDGVDAAPESDALEVIPAAAPDDRDDLQRIDGIGPGAERMPLDRGVHSFRQIADLDERGGVELDAPVPELGGPATRDDGVARARDPLPLAPAGSASTLEIIDRADAPPAGERDDLTLIRGVGPVLERLLHDRGIYAFRQLAALDDRGVDELDDLLDAFPGRVRRDDWVGQARELRRRHGA